MTWRIAVAAALTIVLCLWRGAGGDPISNAAERWLVDLRFQIRGSWEAVDTVAVVAIDEVAAARFTNAAQRRQAIADALPRILSAGARVVAIDVIFAETTAADGALSAALASTDRVVIAASAEATAQLGDLASPEIDTALTRSAISAVVNARPGELAAPSILPTPAIASAAWLGHVNVARSAGGGVYAAPVALGVGEGRMLPAMALRAAAILMDAQITLVRGREVRIGDRRLPLDRTDRLLIDHLGGPGTVPTFGLVEVLEGDVPADAFAGRAVFIGGSGESLGDMFATPFAPNVPGVEINAALAAGLLSGRWLSHDIGTFAASALVAMVLFAAAAAMGRVRTLGLYMAGLAAVWGVGLALLQVAFSGWGIWLDATSIMGGLLLGSAAGAADGFLAQTRLSTRLSRERANLARFLAPGLAPTLAREGGPGFRRRSQTAAVLVVDVVGFTSLAEAASGERATDYLERLHAHFERAGAGHGAIITDFQGDGAMLVFGLPDPRVDDGARALACALWLAREPAPPFGGEGATALRPALRIAVHQGPVIAAVLGGAHQSVVTVAGDTVNVAHRLQEVAKAVGASIVTTRETLDAAFQGQDTWPGWQRHSLQQIRGREQLAEIWIRTPAENRPIQEPPVVPEADLR